MLKIRRFILLALLAAALPLSLLRPVRADLIATSSGTVVSFDNSQSILTVNTRLGSQSFKTDNTTQVLLNDHTATTQNIQANDRVNVTYNFVTSVATLIHLF